jgi:GLPGLI family protein
MKKLFLTTVICFVTAVAATAQQRVVAECTITYSINVEGTGNADKEVIDALKATVKTTYIKANDSRTDLVSPSFQQTILYNKTSKTATVLREFGNNKYMIRMDNARWTAENKRYEGMTISFSPGETKTILGYECKKAVMHLKDSSMFTIYYAANIIPSVREFEYQFKDVPGFVLEYESQEAERGKITYTATKINLSPVQVSRFDIPAGGYRLLN